MDDLRNSYDVDIMGGNGPERSNTHLTRERLLSLSQGFPIIVAEAPSGYGKTSLARDWLNLAPVGSRTVWIALRAGVFDPTTIIDRHCSTLTGWANVRREVSLDDEANRATAFARMADLLIDQESPLWIVFDDAEQIVNSPGVGYLQRLLEGASERLRIFIATQPTSLGVGLGNLTAQNKVCWISADSLAMTRLEIEALAKLRDIKLISDQLSWLLQVTQGWPALVQLSIGRNLAGNKKQSQQISASGPIDEYIYERFLAGMEISERHDLWSLACIGSAPFEVLCLVCSTGLNASLSRFSKIGIVQEENNSGLKCIRLHPLVREAALRFIGEARPQLKQDIHLTAANWYWKNGYGEYAVDLLLRVGAGQLDQSREWILDIAERLIFLTGQHNVVIDLVERWEHVAQGSDPALDSMAAWALVFTRRFEEANIRIDRALSFNENPGVEILQKAIIAALKDDFESAGMLATRWLKKSAPDNSFYTGAALTVHAFDMKCIGDLSSAKTALFEAQVAFSEARSSYGTCWAYIVGALALIKAGRHRDALAEVERGYSIGCEAFGVRRNSPILGGIEAFLRYERNELEEARNVLDEALVLTTDLGVVDSIVLGFTAAARLQVVQGNLGGALDILAKGERCGAQRGFHRLSLSLAAERALLLIRCGACGEAAYTLKSAGIVLEKLGANNIIADRAVRLYSRMCLAEGEPTRARNLILPALAHARSAGQRFKLCELLALQALAEDLLGNEKVAFELLSEALELGNAEGYVRVFRDEGVDLFDLVSRWRDSRCSIRQKNSSDDWASVILDDIQHPHVTIRQQSQTAAGCLNKREKQIISLLHQGLSNAQIAERCFLVEGTVKWHLHNIFTKLGVRSRNAVLSSSRALGIN